MAGGPIETTERASSPGYDASFERLDSPATESKDVLRRSSARITRTFLASLRSHFTREIEAAANRLSSDFDERIKIFNDKARDSDVIRSLLSSDRIITISGVGNSAEGSDLRLWSTEKGSPQGAVKSVAPSLIWEAHFDDGISCLTPSPNEALVVIGTKGLIGVYSMTEKEIPLSCKGAFEIAGDHSVRSMSFSRDGRFLDIASQDGVLRILSVENNGAKLKELACFYIDLETNKVMDRSSADISQAA